MSNFIKKIKDNKVFVTLVLFFLLYVLFKNGNDKIVYLGVNYLFVTIYSIGIVVVFLIIRKLSWFLKSAILELIIVSAFLGYVFVVVVLMPINKFNIDYYSANTPYLIVECPLLSISKRRMSRGMYISLKEEKVFIRGYRSIFNDLESSKKRIDDYVVDVEYKRGIFNSIIILKSKIRYKYPTH